MIFQHLSLTYCVLLVKDQSSFYEIRSLAMGINNSGISELTLLFTENDSALKIA